MSSKSPGSSTPSFKVTQLQHSVGLDSGLLGSLPEGVDEQLVVLYTHLAFIAPKAYSPS